MYALVKYLYDLHCSACKEVIADRGLVSNVFESNGEPSEEEALPFDYDEYAKYKILCDCGKTMTFTSPETVERLKAEEQATRRVGPPVVRIA